MEKGMKNSIRRFKKRLKNANAVVKQIRAGEWDFSPQYGVCFRAKRNGFELWVANGPFFCDTTPRAFGLLLRHYVWWMAAESATRKAESATRKAKAEHRESEKNNIPTLYD